MPMTATVETVFPTARLRLFVTLAIVVVAFAVSMVVLPWQVAAMVAWDAGAVFFVAWLFVTLWRADSETTERWAGREDDSRRAAEIVLLMASVASLVGVGFGLIKSAHSKGLAEAGITGLAILTVVVSWLAVHTVFTLRYAHLYMAHGGGIDFNQDDDPDYRDFAYLALTLGMTYQVSDTDLQHKEIRRTALHHALLSYVFGTVIVAMTINVVAGLVK